MDQRQKISDIIDAALASPGGLREWIEQTPREAFIAGDCNECPVALYLESNLKEAGLDFVAVDVAPAGIDDCRHYTVTVWRDGGDPIYCAVPDWTVGFVRRFDDLDGRGRGREVIGKARLVESMREWPIWQ